MVVDTIAYVTKVYQNTDSDPPEEDRTGDPVVRVASGGSVIVTAECEEGIVEFAASMEERVAVGDSVHLRIEHGPATRS